ncbi:UNVERIFIED_CONTAM: hypothetical protein K2H54_036864 [Gekko kuhli]
MFGLNRVAQALGKFSKRLLRAANAAHETECGLLHSTPPISWVFSQQTVNVFVCDNLPISSQSLTSVPASLANIPYKTVGLNDMKRHFPEFQHFQILNKCVARSMGKDFSIRNHHTRVLYPQESSLDHKA